MKPADLKILRTRLNLTQSEFAAWLGVTRNTVARWEMGMHPISAIAVRLITTLKRATKT
jgi:DNA-binding transcriptional regulator YiaG